MTTAPASPLEPCPWCGSTKVYVDTDPDICGSCYNLTCCARGPCCKTEAEAIAAWNGGVLRERLKAAEADRDEWIEVNRKLIEARKAAEARVKELEKRLEEEKAIVESMCKALGV